MKDIALARSGPSTRLAPPKNGVSVDGIADDTAAGGGEYTEVNSNWGAGDGADVAGIAAANADKDSGARTPVGSGGTIGAMDTEATPAPVAAAALADGMLLAKKSNAGRAGAGAAGAAGTAGIGAPSASMSSSPA